MTEQTLRNVYYCTPAQIRETTSIEKDVSDEKIAFMQQHCEIFHINPILGIDLALTVKTELYANMVSGITLSTGTTTLLEYIKDVEAYSVHYEILPSINFKTTRGGSMIMNPGNAGAADLDSIVFLRKNLSEFLSSYKERLRCFLEDNKSSYPDYVSLNKDDFFSKNNSQGFLFY